MTDIISPQPSFMQKNRLLIKAFFVGVLILVLLIPTLFIENLVNERKERREEVVKEVSNKWSGEQTISGPYLVIPYTIRDTNTKQSPITKYIYILPDELMINTHILPETRARSIYKVPVYTADVTLQGKFENIKALLNDNLSNMHFENSRLCVGIADFKGINEDIFLKWNSNTLPFDISPSDDDLLTEGINTSLPLTVDNISTSNQFTIHIRLKGSERMYFTPMGSSTEVHMESSWSNPAFDGKYLPDSHTVSDSGFIADWKILHFNRNFRQAFTNATTTATQIKESAFGINFLQPVDAYAQTMRSIKYAILMISLTFFLYFFIEILQRNPVHPLQYMLVGFALVVFYSLLLSISEYTSFAIAYLISCASTVLLIGWYTKSIFRKWRVVFSFSIVLSLLYLFIYVLIQLQDNALLFGTIGLFILLATVMYFSRKIDWYNAEQPVAG